MKIISLAVGLVYLGLVSCGRDYVWKCKGNDMLNIVEFYKSRDLCVERGVQNLFVQAICNAKNLLLLDARTGNINEIEFANLPAKFLPEEAQAKVGEMFAQCIATFKPTVNRNAPDFFANDPQATADRYMSFWTCVWGSVMSVCESQFDPEIVGIESITQYSALPSV